MDGSNLSAALSTANGINAAAVRGIVGARLFAAEARKRDSIVLNGLVLVRHLRS